MRARRLARKALFALTVALILAWTLFPFYWAIVSSFRSGAELFSSDLLPKSLDLTNYKQVFTEQSFGRNILNSVMVASLSVGLSLLLGVLAAYAIGRMRFRGRGPLLILILVVSMFPQVAVLSGLFELLLGMGLLNSWFGLAASYLIFTLPFNVWIISTFMAQFPKSMEEAALIDGASRLRILFKVFVPLLPPVLLTTGLLSFILAWNEFLFALTFSITNESRTVPVAIALISGASQFELPWGTIMAASVIVTVPLLALVFVFQRRIVSGLTAGAVKG